MGKLPGDVSHDLGEGGEHLRDLLEVTREQHLRRGGRGRAGCPTRRRSDVRGMTAEGAPRSASRRAPFPARAAWSVVCDAGVEGVLCFYTRYTNTPSRIRLSFLVLCTMGSQKEVVRTK